MKRALVLLLVIGCAESQPLPRLRREGIEVLIVREENGPRHVFITDLDADLPAEIPTGFPPDAILSFEVVYYDKGEGVFVDDVALEEGKTGGRDLPNTHHSAFSITRVSRGDPLDWVEEKEGLPVEAMGLRIDGARACDEALCLSRGRCVTDCAAPSRTEIFPRRQREPCPETWLGQNDGCRPYEAQACDDGVRVPGAGCVSFECPVGPWPDVQAAAFVDEAALAGGDGSAAAPFQDLLDALVMGVTGTVALAAGRYQIPIGLPAGMSLVGGCPERTSVWSSQVPFTSLHLEGVRVESPHSLLGGRLQDVWAEDSMELLGTSAQNVRLGEVALADDAHLERSEAFGVTVTGPAQLSQVTVSGTVTTAATLVAEELAVFGPILLRGAAVLNHTFVEDGSLRVDSSEAVDIAGLTMIRPAPESLFIRGSASLTDVSITDPPNNGINLFGGSVEMSRVSVVDAGVAGIKGVDCIIIASSVFASGGNAGIDADNCDLEVRRFEIVDSRNGAKLINSESAFADGLFGTVDGVGTNASLNMTRVQVFASQHGLLLEESVLGEAFASLSRVAIDGQGNGGIGISVPPGANMQLTFSVVEGFGTGLWIEAPHTLQESAVVANAVGISVSDSADLSSTDKLILDNTQNIEIRP